MQYLTHALDGRSELVHFLVNAIDLLSGFRIWIVGIHELLGVLIQNFPRAFVRSNVGLSSIGVSSGMEQA